MAMFLIPITHFIICGIVLVLFWFWKNRDSINLYLELGSCYNTVPILEHLYRAIGSKENLMNLSIKMANHAIASGGLSSYWVLQKLYVVVANADDADHLLKQHLEKGDFYLYIKLLLRNSLLCAPVAKPPYNTFPTGFTPRPTLPQKSIPIYMTLYYYKPRIDGNTWRLHLYFFSPDATVHIWRRRRKAMNLLFSHHNVLTFEPAFIKDSYRLVEKFRPMVGKGAFCVHDACNAMAFDSTCDTILNMDLNSQNNPHEPLRAATNYMLDGLGMVMLTIPARIKFLRKRMWWCRIGRKHREIMRYYVDEAFSHQKSMKLCNNDIGENRETKNVSLFSLTTHRNSRCKLDIKELHEETFLLLLAAMDTTSTSLSFTILLLSWYPEVQNKAYKEVIDVLEDSDRSLTVEDLPRLRYLDAVIKESQRLYPPVPVITRRACSDVTLPSGLRVDKGRNIFIHIWAINRNPKHWGPDAELFRPERFLEDTQPPHAFLSFSSGSRCCPGVQFASMLMKTALATILREYRLLPALEVARHPRLVTNGLMKADRFPIRLELRTNK